MNYITQKFRKFANKGLTLNGCLIDKNGIVSNFLNTNYVMTEIHNNLIMSEYEFEIKIKFDMLNEDNLIFGAYSSPSYTKYTTLLFCKNNSEGFIWRVAMPYNYQTNQIRLSSYIKPEIGKWYYINCLHDKTTYYLKVFDEHHNLIKEVKTNRGIPASAQNENLNFGYLQPETNLGNGYVDLSESWVKQNNKLISSWSI